MEPDMAFAVHRTGVRALPNGTSTPLEFFMLFLSLEMLQRMKQETNR